jgi:hypothetical protein
MWGGVGWDLMEVWVEGVGPCSLAAARQVKGVIGAIEFDYFDLDLATYLGLCPADLMWRRVGGGAVARHHAALAHRQRPRNVHHLCREARGV